MIYNIIIFCTSLLVIVTFIILTTGCSLPLHYQIASWTLDGVSYITTNKSVTDHGISIVAQKDCALLRVVHGDEICINDR